MHDSGVSIRADGTLLAQHLEHPGARNRLPHPGAIADNRAQREIAEAAAYEAWLQFGRETGRGARPLDPLRSSLGDTMADLARVKPGRPVRELAELAEADLGVAIELARPAQASSGATITIDAGPKR